MMSSLRTRLLLVCGLIHNLLAATGTAQFAPPLFDALNGSLESQELSYHLAKRGFNNGVQLRILNLGASIVWGQNSPDGNGWRYGLRNQLVYNGNPVNMVGSVHAGTMADSDCEGWPGYTISQVAAKAELSISSQPNLVLLHVGTNDALGGVDIANAGARLGTLIDRLFSAIPGVTIIASTLFPNANSATQANVRTINSQIPGIVRARQTSGRKITYVDFSSSYFSLGDIGSDGTHPTQSGYMKAAEVWFQGIQAANSQGWLSSPAAVSGLSDAISSGSTTCNKIPGAAIGPTQIQMGSGSDDGAYTHIGEYFGGFAGFTNPSTVNFNNPFPEGVFWADINGDGIDDYVYVGSNSNYGLGVALSLGSGAFGNYLYFTFAPSCNRPGIHFVDMTGDGRDDFCCLGPDGGLVCWQNTVGADSRSPNWQAMGTVKASEGYPQAQVRLADIDGDGRCDYVVFDASTRYIYGWRNGALSNSAPAYWYAMRGVISNLPPRALSGWRFVDLNGDKKADLVWVSPEGKVTTWINRRGFSPGLGPAFVSKGITHQGSASAVNVTFGSSMGSGRADYALTSIRNGNVYVERWTNKDYGGTMVRGDGARYCDMTGDGSDDYVFIDSAGAITLFENNHNWGYWIPWGVIYNANRVRPEIHLADFDGDGKCDILLVDKGTGATTAILNKYNGKAFTWSNIGVVTGSARCTEGYGRDKHDLGVRWNDLDGDKRADFLCMQTNGVVNGYLNKGVGNMVSVGLIKHEEGKERKNLRLADINGDGRDDFLYVNMIDGAVTAWYNGGQIPSSGSAFQWNWQGIVATGGSSRGACVEFGALYGQKRADYIVVEPAENKAWTWFNVCPDGAGPVSPNLPSGAPPVPNPVPGQTLPTGGGIVISTTTNYDGKTTILTNTIVPTTTTDSRGVTVTGTITRGPQPITTPPPTSKLTTYSGFPPGITWASTSVPSNTHDSEGFPILGPWPQCWFCPPDSHGIWLGGIGPGVYPPGGPPAGLPTPFPTLTIKPDGTPEYSSKDDKCSTNTVTNYWVSCNSARTSCTTTSSKVLSGCSAKATQYTDTPSCPLDEPIDQGDLGAGTEITVKTTLPGVTTATLKPSPTSTTKAPTSTRTAYPTQTSIDDRQAHCFTGTDGQGHVEYTMEEGQAVVDSWCERHPVLSPDLVPALVEAYDTGNGKIVYVTARWAPNQTGCLPKKAFNFNDGSGGCYQVFNPGYYCQNYAPDTPSSFGGAYVFNSPDSGCIEFVQLASQASSVAQVAAVMRIAVASPTSVVAFNTSVAQYVMTETPSGQYGDVPATLTDIGGIYFNSSAVG